MTLGGSLIAVVGFPGSVVAAALVVGGVALLLLAVLDPSPFDREIAHRRKTATAAREAEAGRTFTQSLGVIRKCRVALEVAFALVLGGQLLGQGSVTFPLFVYNMLGVT